MKEITIRLLIITIGFFLAYLDYFYTINISVFCLIFILYHIIYPYLFTPFFTDWIIKITKIKKNLSGWATGVFLLILPETIITIYLIVHTLFLSDLDVLSQKLIPNLQMSDINGYKFFMLVMSLGQWVVTMIVGGFFGFISSITLCKKVRMGSSTN